MGGILTHPVMNFHIERKGNNHVCTTVVSVNGYRSDMEDAHTMELEQKTKSGREFMLFGIYDGHGGQMAAKMQSKKLPERMCELDDPRDENAIKNMLLEQDQEFLEQQEYVDHGSTCIAVIVEYDKNEKVYKYVCANIGDSRALCLHPSTLLAPKYEELSEDHKPTNDQERERINRAGGYVTSARVDGSLAQSRAIGDGHYKKNQSLPLIEQKVIAVPDFKSGVMRKGDILMLFCDGQIEQGTNRDIVIDTIAEQRKQRTLNKRKRRKKDTTNTTNTNTTTNNNTNNSASDATNNKMDDTNASNRNTTTTGTNSNTTNTSGTKTNIDYGSILCKQIDTSIFKLGSKDNHTVMLIALGVDTGATYVKEYGDKTLIPGRFHDYAHDQEFLETYTLDQRNNGYQQEDVLDQITSYEKKHGYGVTIKQADTTIPAVPLEQFMQLLNGCSPEQSSFLSPYLNEEDDEDQNTQDDANQTWQQFK